jgi:hypothetical protein
MSLETRAQQTSGILFGHGYSPTRTGSSSPARYTTLLTGPLTTPRVTHEQFVVWTAKARR